MILQVKENKNFEALAACSGMTQDQLNDRIISSLWGADAIREENFYLGFNIKELLQGIDFSEKDFVASILGDTTPLSEILLNCVIVGSNDPKDCPDCGCTVEVETDGAFGIVWEEHFCVNEYCGYFSSTEPDWDL